MTESLREVAPRLWVSDRNSAEILGDSVSLVIDCTGRGPTVGNGRTVSIRPSGRTNHRWAPDDLDKIATLVSLKIEAGGDVLIHCNAGRSRSACAAAATLLRMGLETNLEAAIRRVQIPGRRVNNHSLAGLREWWNSRLQGNLFK